MNELTDLDAWLSSECAPVAVYFDDADCVEYVREDTTCVYKRVGSFLTLVYDETDMIPVGFKLKGFRNVFTRMKARGELKGVEFVDVIVVLEEICSEIGEEIFADQSRSQAYEAAKKLAKDAKLYDLPLAA